MSQKESEWEKEFYEKFVDDHGMVTRVYGIDLENFVKHQIDTEVSTREKEIAEEVKKKRQVGITYNNTCENGGLYNEALDDVLKILNHK